MGKNQAVLGKSQKQRERGKATTRSKVSNAERGIGARLFVDHEIDGRSAWARRFRDINAALLADLGFPRRTLSQAQLQLCRRSATLSILLEKMEGELACGRFDPKFDAEHYARLTSQLSRCLQQLGLERVDDDLPGSVDQYLRDNHGPAPATVPP